MDMLFNRMMKHEVEEIWMKGKIKNNQKAETLLRRWIPEESMEVIRDVKKGDKDLESSGEFGTTEPEPIVYGNIVISENVKAALKLHPKKRIYEKIDTTRIETEIEKGICKCRYALMNKTEIETNDGEEGGNVANRVDEDDDECVVYDTAKKVANYSNLRVTDLPTCQRLYPPKPATITKEIHLQNLREKLLRKVEEYKQKRCNKTGHIKESNLSRMEFEGLKEIKENKEMVVFSTDKSARLAADSIENYEAALHEHTKDDTKVGEKEVRKIENKMNNHLKYFNSMFRVGETWGHEDRIS